MPSKFGGVAVDEGTGSRFGGVAVPDPEPPSALERFGQSWWDNSVLKHPIDSVVGLYKSLTTMPDYHQLSAEEKAQVDAQVSKAFADAAHPTPEYAGMVASKGTNAALVSGATALLAKGFGVAVDSGIGPALKAGAQAAAPDVLAGGAKVGVGAALADVVPGPLKYVAGIAPATSGSRQIVRGLRKGFDAGKASLADRAAANAAAAAPVAVPPAPAPVAGLLQAGPIITPAPADASFVRAVPAEYATPEEPPVAPAAAAAAQPVAEPTDLEKQLQASLDRHPKADENRVQAADRWAQNLKQLNVPAPAPGDDAAWANLSRSLGERAGYVPAPDTRQMIRERLAATPPTVQTLLDKSKAAFDAARKKP